MARQGSSELSFTPSLDIYLLIRTHDHVGCGGLLVAIHVQNMTRFIYEIFVFIFRLIAKGDRAIAPPDADQRSNGGLLDPASILSQLRYRLIVLWAKCIGAAKWSNVVGKEKEGRSMV